MSASPRNPLVEELVPPPDPVRCVEQLADLPNRVFLDSALRESRLGRYSYVSADPFAVVVASKGEADALGSLRRTLAPCRADPVAGLPPFQGGAVGYIAYDWGLALERLPAPIYDDLGLDDVVLGLYDWVIAWDHVKSKAWLISTGMPETEGAAKARRAAERAAAVRRQLTRSVRPSGDSGVRLKPDTTDRGLLLPADAGARSVGLPADPGARSVGLPADPGARSVRLPADPGARSVRLPADPGARSVRLQADHGPANAGRYGPVQPAPSYPIDNGWWDSSLALRSSFTRDGYLRAVERVREYIFAGDVFQANLSQRFETPLAGSPWSLYRRLRERNPAPFAAFLDFPGVAVLSASPERFLRVDRDGRVETRPIKGTRPRGLGPEHDAALGQALAESNKDRAENLMIVDLMRNDLSRVCAPGTVRVTELFALERYATVHHLVSTVVGQLAPGADALDLVGAAFPGGSITGAPKLRAMEIIAELEPARRGVYCGSIGYWSITGELDVSIAIRTAVARNGRVYFNAGGGIVADSDPAEEYQETLDKARGLIDALAVPDDSRHR